MKIAFILSSLSIGGLEMQTITLANQLKNVYNCQVTLIVLRNITDLEYKIDVNIQIMYILSKSFYDKKCICQLHDTISKEKFDIIFAEEMYAGLYARKATINSPYESSTSIVIHTTILANFKEKIKNIYYKRLVNKYPYRIFVSHNQMAYWQNKYKIKALNSLVIHNGIDTEYFSYDKMNMLDLAKLKNTLGINENTFVILKCGRLIPEKNDMFLIHASERFKKRYDVDIRILLVGDGSERSTIEKYIKKNNLNSIVKLIGNVEDIRPYIAISDFGTLPSYATETLSMAALEQMSMGKPMLMSSIGGASEIVEEDKNGFLFESNNQAEFIEKIHLLLLRKKEGLLDEMGIYARKSVIDRFSLNQMSKIYMEFILRSKEM